MSATRTVTEWPAVGALREQFAERARLTAARRQGETGWSADETCRQVRSAAIESANSIARALVDAAEMGLDVWQTTR